MAAELGYIQVLGPEPAVWLRCDRCQTADAFVLDDGGVRCSSCGATYGFAVHEGKRYERDKLRWVPQKDGPAALGSWEIAWDRIFGLGVLLGGGALLYWVWVS